MVLKWGAAMLASTRPEWLPDQWPDGCLWQLPGAVDIPRVRALGGPLIASGRADRIAPGILAAAGVERTGERLPAGYRLGVPADLDLPREERVHLPEREAVTAASGAHVAYDSRGTPLLVGRDGIYHWQPPDLADPGNPLVPHSQIGTVSPYVAAARALNAGAREAGGVSVDPVAAHEPVTVSSWRSDGAVHLLLGNLESGWMGDARFERGVTVRLPRARLGLDPAARYRAVPLNREAPAVEPETSPGLDTDVLVLRLTMPAAGCLVVRLEAAP